MVVAESTLLGCISGGYPSIVSERENVSQLRRREMNQLKTHPVVPFVVECCDTQVICDAESEGTSEDTGHVDT